MAYGDLIVAAGRWLARLTAACGVLLAVTAAAAAADVFTASVPVEVKAASAMQARDRAIAEGEAKAFTQVLQRLTRRSDWQSLPRPGGSDLADNVQSFELRDERSTPASYAATVVVHFRPSAIRRALQRARIPFSETSSRPVLVLPVYQWNGRNVLFDGPNPWRDAWARRNPDETLVPLQVPRGDATDRSALSADDAMSGDESRLLAFARRYGAGAVIVARAVHTADSGGGHPVLDVTATRYGDGAGEAPITEHVVGAPDESIDALADRTTGKVADDVDDAWKSITIIGRDQPEQTVEVEVPISTLADLAEVQRRLGGVAAVGRHDLRMVERNGARLRLSFAGGIERLRLALGQSGLELVPAETQPSPGPAGYPGTAGPAPGYPAPGYPPTGQGGQGQGYPAQGYPAQGYPAQGAPGQGAPGQAGYPGAAGEPEGRPAWILRLAGAGSR